MDRRTPLAFSAAEYAARVSGVRRRMAARGIDTLLIFVPENICYLTGYETIGYASFQTFVLRAEETLLFVREMERTVAETTTWLEEFEIYTDTDDPVTTLAVMMRRRSWGAGRVAAEMRGWFTPAAVMDRLRGTLGDMTDGSGLVEQGRRIKSAAEIALIREACHVTEAGMAAALAAIRPGATENEVASAAYAGMMAAGSDFMVGDPIVTSGWRSGVAHSTFANRRIEPGDALLIELGGCRRRYFGPLMRGAAVAPVRDELHRMAAVISAALEAAIATIRPGATSDEVDAACRGVLEDAGYESYFRKRTGYSVGVAYAPDWGEGHIVSLRRGDTTVLEPGMVFHIPPALRVPRQYGLGFSETVFVADGGCEVLTSFPRALHVAS